jgi:hypothetical protein
MTGEIWIWRRSGETLGNIIGDAAFTTRDAAIASLEYSSHKLVERPVKISDEKDVATQRLFELWLAPSQTSDGITWETYALMAISLFTDQIHL